jgi:hypothetical protein
MRDSAANAVQQKYPTEGKADVVILAITEIPLATPEMP